MSDGNDNWMPTAAELAEFRDLVRNHIKHDPFAMLIISADGFETKINIVHEEIAKFVDEKRAARAAMPLPTEGDLRDPRFVAIREATRGWRTAGNDDVDERDVLAILDAIRRRA